MTMVCPWCKEPTGAPISVGFKASISSGGVPIIACSNCVRDLGILPLSEHPLDTDGLPRYRDEPQPRPVRRTRRGRPGVA